MKIAITILRYGVTQFGERYTDVQDRDKGSTSRLHGHVTAIQAEQELVWYRKRTGDVHADRT